MGGDTPNHAAGSDDLRRQLTLRTRVLRASRALGEAVAVELELEPLCDLVVDHLVAALGAEAVALVFTTEDSGGLTLKRVGGPGAAELAGGWGRGVYEVAAEAHSQQRLVRRSEPALAAEAAGHHPAAAMAALPLLLSTDSSTPAARTSAALPLVADSKVKGVVVATWSSVGQRPTDDDAEMLEVLGSQVAAAIDNAWLYRELRELNAQLENKVRLRTRELEQSNADLANALVDRQLAEEQLVQSAKMASLGQLTAGIAHEINNPLAYAVNNVALAAERADALAQHCSVLRASLEIEQVADPAQRRDLALGVIRSLADEPSLRTDVAALLAETDRLGTAAAADLASDFLRYLRLRHEERAAGRGEEGTAGGLLARAQEGLGRVKQIVLDLRTFARLDEAEQKEVDLDASIAGTLTIVEHLAREGQVRLRQVRGLSGSHPCYPAKLNQVVLNLVTNALQATPPGGEVTVSTELGPQGPVIRVTDTGRGIPEDVLPRVFDPFFTTKAVGAGTGLGLSVSYRIIEEHGGSIRVRSEAGQGTEFIVQLPTHGRVRRGS